MSRGEYLHWSEAGGPNECEHGYAEGIPCPNCDATPRIQELSAEVEGLEAEVIAEHELNRKAMAEIERLRAFVQKVALYSNDAWLAREADELAPGASLNAA